MDYESIKAINNSSLSWFARSPKYYNAMLHGEIKQSEASYFDLGTALHCAVLQPTVFNDSYVVLDGTAPTHNYHVEFCKKVISGVSIVDAYSLIYSTKGKKPEDITKAANELYTQYAAYIKFINDNKGKTFIEKSDHDIMQLMKNSLASHKAASDILFSDFELKQGRKEGSVIIETELIIEFIWPRLGIKCKSRLDKVIIDLENKTIKLIDLKSLSKPVKDFRYSCIKFGYRRQMGFYSVALADYLELLGINPLEFKIDHIFAAVESNNLYETRVFAMDKHDVLCGIAEAHELLSRIKQHEELGEWDYPLEYYTGTGVEPLKIENNDESNNDE